MYKTKEFSTFLSRGFLHDKAKEKKVITYITPPHPQGTSDDTIAAVLATLNEVIKKSGEFSRSLLETGGVERLLNLTKQRHRHTPRVLKFAGTIDFLSLSFSVLSLYSSVESGANTSALSVHIRIPELKPDVYQSDH